VSGGVTYKYDGKFWETPQLEVSLITIEKGSFSKAILKSITTDKFDIYLNIVL